MSSAVSKDEEEEERRIGSNAKVRIRFQSRLSILKGLPKSPFALPIELNEDGLNEVVRHVLNLDKEHVGRFNFYVVEDGEILIGTLREYLRIKGRSTEALMILECVATAPKPEPKESPTQPDWVSSLCVREEQIVSGCYDGSIRVYDAKTGHEIATGAAHTEPIKDVAFVGSDVVVSASKDSTAVVWTYEDAKLTFAGVCRDHNDSVDCVAARPRSDVAQFATGGWDTVVRLWTWSPTSSENDDDDDDDTVKKRRRDMNGDAVVVDSKTLKPSLELNDHSACVTSMVWTRQGRLCTGSWDRSIRVFDVDVGACESTINCGRVVCDVAAQPSSSSSSESSQLLLSAHPDGKVRLWDLRIKEGENVVASRTFKGGHDGWVSGIAWTDDDNFVTSGYDGSLALWDRRGNRPIHRLEAAHEGKALCVASTTSTIASGGEDGRLRLYNR